MQSAPPNIILFGESGSGKSSIINMLAEREVAHVSSSVRGCTFESARYEVSIFGKTYHLHDTAGLDEGDAGTVPNQQAIVQLFRLLKSLETGVSLLVFCMRGPRIKESAHKNWRLFQEIICRQQVPIVLAITCLEQEEDMDAWWVRNRGAFQMYQMFPQGVACITATRGKPNKYGGHRFDDEYEESKLKMWKSLASHHLVVPWKVQTVEWFRMVVTVTYESRWCREPIEHRHVEQVIGMGVQQLMERCEMTRGEAELLGNLLASA